MFGEYSFEREEKIKTLFTDCVDIEVEKTIDAIKIYFTNEFLWDKWLFALNFAKNQNYGERDIDKYYISHPLRLCRFLATALNHKSNYFCESLIASLLHNAIEKKILSFNEISESYTPWIANAINTLTVNRDEITTRNGKSAYYERIHASCIEIQTLKIFDKLDNIFAVCLCSDDVIREDYLDEIEVFVRPLLIRNYPNLLEYFDGLITDSRKIGFCKKF